MGNGVGYGGPEPYQLMTDVPKAAEPTNPADAALGQLADELERLGAMLGKLESRLTPVLGEERPKPEEAPEPPHGTSPLVYLVGNMRNTVGVYNSRVQGILGRLEVG